MIPISGEATLLTVRELVISLEPHCSDVLERPPLKVISAIRIQVQVCAFNVAVHGCDDERRSGCSHCKTGTGVEADLPG